MKLGFLKRDAKGKNQLKYRSEKRLTELGKDQKIQMQNSDEKIKG